MSEKNLQIKVIEATKWSTITELSVKLVSPITSMILARLLAPEAFGVVATITMITSFAEMFTDAGFQKYLVQHSFKHEEEKHNYANVAFWTNFVIAIFIWIFIITFKDKIALLVGNPGLGHVIAISSFQLLLTSFSSIQMALYRRDLDFKTLFVVRMLSVLVPLFVTIPLALLGLGYWALIVGSLSTHVLNATVLTIKSKWKPRFYYKKEIIVDMISFSIWSLVEAISMWFTVWVDVFIIGVVLNQYYLGLYRMSKTMVDTLLVIVTAAVVPVLFSTLSRLKNDDVKFKNTFLKAQRFMSYLLFPMGVGLYIYSDLATKILLGNQWSEASNIIAMWAITSVFTIVLGQLCGEVYRSKGLPKLSFIAQLMHLIVLIPAIFIASKYGFWNLVYVRALIRFQYILVHLFIMEKFMGFSINSTIRNISPAVISSIIMGLFAFVLKQNSSSLFWDFTSIFICIIIYVSTLLLFPNARKELRKAIDTVAS